jgi:hypothetical protein
MTGGVSWAGTRRCESLASARAAPRSRSSARPDSLSTRAISATAATMPAVEGMTHDAQSGGGAPASGGGAENWIPPAPGQQHRHRRPPGQPQVMLGPQETAPDRAEHSRSIGIVPGRASRSQGGGGRRSPAQVQVSKRDSQLSAETRTTQDAAGESRKDRRRGEPSWGDKYQSGHQARVRCCGAQRGVPADAVADQDCGIGERALEALG